MKRVRTENNLISTRFFFYFNGAREIREYISIICVAQRVE